ncbi:MAG TPA: hypothetical protein GXX36_04075 [Clostridiaceae bacterium]|nr:hypothetical protein [Clostridiaceae bacterium]
MIMVKNDDIYFKNLIYLIYILVILIIIYVVSILGYKAYSAWKLNDMRNMWKESRERIIETFLANKDIFDDLIKKMYSSQQDIIIEFSNGNIQLYVNGKEEKLDNEFYSLLNKLYSIINCESITLRKDSSGNKVLEIYLGSKNYDKKNVFEEYILYCKDKIEGITDEFSPGWYYKVSWYT